MFTNAILLVASLAFSSVHAASLLGGLLGGGTNNDGGLGNILGLGHSNGAPDLGRRHRALRARTYGYAINSDSTTTRDACNVGPPQCCNTLYSPTRNDGANDVLTSLLGSDMPVASNLLVGIHCSPIGDLLAGPKCGSQPVCCTGNKFDGIINIGCSPLSL